MKTDVIRRGDIYYANLDPVVGSEQGDNRPVIIVQNSIGNINSPTVIVLPLTKQTQKNRLPTHVCIPKDHGLEANSLALAEQVRTIDKSRLGNYIGWVGEAMEIEIDNALLVSLGIKNKLSIMELALCHRCKSDFEDDDDRLLVKCGWQAIKEKCDFCGVGRGWIYRVINTAAAV